MNQRENHDQTLADLALRASYEIESIASVLQAHFQRASAQDQFVLGLAIRLEALASVVMNATGGDEHGADFEEARAALIGPAAVRLSTATG